MIKEKLDACFNRIQTLEIRASLSNMEILVQTLYDLRDIYNELGGAESAVDTEQRDDH